MVQVGDWIRLHEDAMQEVGTERIPTGMLLRVTEVTDEHGTIRVKPPFEGACDIYWGWEYDVVPCPERVQIHGGDNVTIKNCIIEGPLPDWARDTMVPGMSITTKAAKPDLVNHPPHYEIKGDMEVIDVIEALAKDDAWYANAIKYLLRAKKKGKLTEDLGKCKFYIDRMLRDAESEAK